MLQLKNIKFTKKIFEGKFPISSMGEEITNRSSNS